MRTESGIYMDFVAILVPMGRTILGTQLNLNQKLQRCSIQSLLPENSYFSLKQRSFALEIRVYFGLILSPSACSVLTSLSFTKGRRGCDGGWDERAGKGKAGRRGRWSMTWVLKLNSLIRGYG